MNNHLIVKTLTIELFIFVSHYKLKNMKNFKKISRENLKTIKDGLDSAMKNSIVYQNLAVPMAHADR
jgi:hypothetical protein